MKIKITVKENPIQEEQINWQELPIGTVFEWDSGAKGLVYADGPGEFSSKGVLMLQGVNSSNFGPIKAHGFLKCTIVRVLGTLTEVIVETDQ